MSVGFFDLWFDSDYRQRRDIDTLGDEEATLSDNVGTRSERVRLLRKLCDVCQP